MCPLTDGGVKIGEILEVLRLEILGDETSGVEAAFNMELGVMIAGVETRTNLGVDARTGAGVV